MLVVLLFCSQRVESDCTWWTGYFIWSVYCPALSHYFPSFLGVFSPYMGPPRCCEALEAWNIFLFCPLGQAEHRGSCMLPVTSVVHLNHGDHPSLWEYISGAFPATQQEDGTFVKEKTCHHLQKKGLHRKEADSDLWFCSKSAAFLTFRSQQRWKTPGQPLYSLGEKSKKTW